MGTYVLDVQSGSLPRRRPRVPATASPPPVDSSAERREERVLPSPVDAPRVDFKRMSSCALPFAPPHAVLLVLAFAAGACGGTGAHEATAADAGRDVGGEGPSLGGGVGSDPLGPGDASTAHRVTLLFATTCAGGPETSCHGNHAGGLSLVLTPDGGDVIGVPSLEDPTLLRVKPGDPEHSYVERKVRMDGGVDGGRMPLGAPYDPRIESLVRAWITEGAPTE